MSVAVEARIKGAIGRLAIDLAFRLEQGTVTALAGPSGAGKTTVLRWLAGLEALPGQLTVGDEVWQDGRHGLPAHLRRVGMVFQGQGLLPHKSVRGNLDYAAGRASDPLAIGEVVALTSIEALLDRSPATLSGGEAQRAALARALIGRPNLLLLDEPFSAIDREARGELAALFARLFCERRMTVLLVSHDVGELSSLAANVIRIRDGRRISDRFEPAES